MDDFIILSPLLIRKKIIYVHITEVSTSPVICCYTYVAVDLSFYLVKYAERWQL